MAVALSHLLSSGPVPPAIAIKGLTADSREVRPGFLFAALKGEKADGTAFVDEAIARGAVAVLAAPGTVAPKDHVHILYDDNPRRRLALMAARFYGDQPALTAAVTGTNGKTSVAIFAARLWQVLGRSAASLGTLGIGGGEVDYKPKLTTPDAVTLHRALADIRHAGIDRLVLEASSHGLLQHRLDGLRITLGGFTNLSRDHLDYHGSFENYLYAKLRLFGEVMPPGSAVAINMDGGHAADVEALCWARGHRIIRVGSGDDVDIRLVSRQPAGNGQDIVLSHEGRRYEARLDLIGDFQASNALVAAALVIASGEDPVRVFAALPQLIGAPGRMQFVSSHPSGASIFVDFAHTPDALRAALVAVRHHTQGRVIVVFGCGGDRDAGKRLPMGAIAAELADVAIVTDDNPRSEKPAGIRRQVMAGCPGGLEIGDRITAIRRAVAMLRPGDRLLVAGKGHERGQTIGDRVLPFDDADQIRLAVGALAEAV